MTMALTRGDVRVELEDIGEGWFGDYDPEFPGDEPLLRFTIYRKNNETGDWDQIEDASYCTRLPAREVTYDEGNRLMQYIMDKVFDEIINDHSIKKLCEELSWIGRMK